MSAVIENIEIGQKFIMPGKRKDVHTVVDILTTTNMAGEVVAVRYVTEHAYMGQILRNYDVVKVTIQKSLFYNPM